MTQNAHSDHDEFDLDWHDDHVVPPHMFPDLEFFFERLSAATFEAVDPRNGKTVLDVGCGRANDAMDLARMGGRCLGLEPSETMIYIAQKDIARDGTGVSLLRGIGEAAVVVACPIGLRAHWGALFQTGGRRDVPAI